MTTHAHCDGCGAQLGGYLEGGLPRPTVYIHGHRDEDSGSGLSPLPLGDFDWCRNCALIAFGAVKAERRAVR